MARLSTSVIEISSPVIFLLFDHTNGYTVVGSIHLQPVQQNGRCEDVSVLCQHFDICGLDNYYPDGAVGICEEFLVQISLPVRSTTRNVELAQSAQDYTK